VVSWMYEHHEAIRADGRKAWEPSAWGANGKAAERSGKGAVVRECDGFCGLRRTVGLLTHRARGLDVWRCPIAAESRRFRGCSRPGIALCG